MKDMSGFVLRYDTTIMDGKEVTYNFRYYTNIEGNSRNTLEISFDNLIDMLLNEIKKRDEIINKIKVTREIAISVTS